MELNSPAGAIAVVLAVISFYGTTYLVIALNVGWRFGYWLASACFGALMVMLSIFWIINPVGPRGTEPIWEPVAAGRDTVAQAQLEEVALTTPAQYPTGPWQAADEGDSEQRDALGSAISNCMSSDPSSLPEAEQEACADAQALAPPEEDIPVLEGTEVAVTYEVTDVRFAEENGRLLGQATVVPVTHDPRVADDPVQGEQVGVSFRIVAVFDKGSILIPAIWSLVIFGLYFAFHLYGLHRAERRKLSPNVT
jgi:hypothetical protein